jgi:hypothetical protein
MLTPLFVVFSLVSADAPTNSQLEELTAIRTVFDANRSRFERGTFTFAYVRFKRCKLEDVKRGSFDSASRTNGSYIFNDKFAKYELLFTDEILTGSASDMGEGKLGADLISFRAVTDRRRAMKHMHMPGSVGAVTHKVLIYSDLGFFHSDIIFPLELGFVDEYRRDVSVILKPVIEHSPGFELVAITHGERVNGREVTKIDTKYNGLSRTLYIDVQRGCIALMSQFSNRNGVTHTQLLDDVRPVEGRGWLPFSATYFVSGRGEHVEITSASFEEVRRENFELDFAKPVPASDMDNRLEFAPQRRWDIAKLPSPSSKSTTHFSGFPAVAEPVMPGEARSGGWARYPVYVLGLAAVAILFRWNRNRHSRKSYNRST